MQPLGDVPQAESSIGRVCGLSPAKGGWQERDLTGVRARLGSGTRHGHWDDVSATVATCTPEHTLVD